MRQVFFFVVIIFMLAILIFLTETLVMRLAKDNGSSKSYFTAQQQLDYANKLLSKGLKEQAAEVFEDYLANPQLKPQEGANLLYRLGNIYMELYKYEKALKNFYKAEIIEPNSEFVQEMNQKIIEALENLGMSAQARYELEARASLGEEKEAKGRIVARIGKREITDAEIDAVLKNAPEGMRKSFEEPQKRLEFIRDYVAQEVLYIKAKRLGLDTKEDIRQTIEQMKKQIIVEHLLNKEIKERLDKISPEDIRLYYEANKQTWFDKNENRQKDLEEVKQEVEYQYMMKKQQEISQGLLKKALEEQEVEIYYTANNNEPKKDQ